MYLKALMPAICTQSTDSASHQCSKFNSLVNYELQSISAYYVIRMIRILYDRFYEQDLLIIFQTLLQVMLYEVIKNIVQSYF